MGQVKKLVSLPNLVAIETVDSASLADKIAAAAEGAGRGEGGSDPVELFIQVDTSNEETKGGVQPKEAAELASHIASCGSSVRFAGLMTIGAPGDLGAFDRLRAARDEVAATLGVPEDEIRLSMGMSGDFEEAIRKGATSVRVGSLIFGSRPAARQQ
ncbi:Plpbp, partial [Symbiodinium pilosum]